MPKPQYAILRFAKYKGPGVHDIEAHNERRKEKYASNPDIDTGLSGLNFHLAEPAGRYRQEAERLIREAGCRTRKDSVRVVEALVTASPEFFEGRPEAGVRAFFERAMEFIGGRQDSGTFLSAVVHMDEKTPHMHLCFVPLTSDGRLSAKEIVGNKKKLGEWQDAFWTHMAEAYPELERGESAGETGREHIPPRLFKQMTRLTRQKQKLDALLSDVKLGNYKERVRQISALLDRYIPDVERMGTELKKYKAAFDSTGAELKALRSESTLKKLRDNQLRRDYEEALAVIGRLPPEVLKQYQGRSTARERKTVSK